MARLDELRDRLPSLYRPDDEDTSGEPLPLGARDVQEIRGEGPLEPTALTTFGYLLRVELAEPSAVREVVLVPGRGPGSVYALELYLLDGDVPRSRPAAVAPVRNDRALFSVEVETDRFALKLGRRGVLTRYLQSLADVFDELDRDATDVLQAHWFRYADRATYDPFFLRARELGNGGDPLDFPYVDDLGRLAALFALPPWQEPARPEVVEDFRTRVGRIVHLYEDGLATTDALRAVVEANLRIERHAGPELRDQPFLLEEFAPLLKRSLAVKGSAKPEELVAPLMRWEVENGSLRASALTVHVEGAQGAGIDSTNRPLIELYEAAGRLERVGLAFQDTVPPGATLRLRPAYSSWIGLDTGIQRAESLPSGEAAADPTAPGPWNAVEVRTRFQLGVSSAIGVHTLLDADVEGGPKTVNALLQTRDRILWIAAESGGVGELWRYDGRNWVKATSKKLPVLHCLAEDGDELLVGTATGLLRLTLHPEEGHPLVPAGTLAALQGPAVYALLRGSDGTWWHGTASGAEHEGELVLAGLEVYAIAEDPSGTLSFGTSLGLLQYQPGPDDWYCYLGKELSEQADDWRVVEPDQLLDEDDVFLPSVTCVHRGPDTSLWLGTESGIARYVARSVGGLTYQTVLEAFPDLTAGTVYEIREDERGTVWFCTDRGLFRYDGRDWSHYGGKRTGWVPLGRADRVYEGLEPEPRGAWRFSRAAGKWERFVGRRAEPAKLKLRTSKEAAVRCVAWADHVAADIDSQPVDPSKFVVRVKPDERRIVTGGLPALPRLPAGKSVWRYLSLEPTPLIAPPERPAWTTEGRLLPGGPEELSAPEPPEPGRFADDAGTARGVAPASRFEEAVFAFRQAARVSFEWNPNELLSVLVRLKQRTSDEPADPIVLDRVWQAIEQVRPAGVRARLAVEETIVRGDGNARI